MAAPRRRRRPAEDADHVRPAGERRLTEFTLPWLSGYEGSIPVRVGNEASGQFQLDVYGELLDALHLDRTSGLSHHDNSWALQRAVLDELEGQWDQPDQSLWEMRGDPRHFVHSKVMAWVGFDRAVLAVEQFGLNGPVDRWRAARDAIHEEVCREGYDAERGTFTQSYGSTTLDAATLLIPQVGFLPPTRPAGHRHGRRDLPGPHPTTASSCATTRRRPATASAAPKAPSSPARSGLPTTCT